MKTSTNYLSSLLGLFILMLLCLLYISLSNGLEPIQPEYAASGDSSTQGFIADNYTYIGYPTNGSSNMAIGNITSGDQPILHGFRMLSDMKEAIKSGLPYKYSPPEQSGIHHSGAEFDVDPECIRKLDLPPKSYFNLSLDTVKDFSFVTAADHTHYIESINCVASIQKHFPGYTIHYYDLGLTKEQVRNVTSWCNVKVHHFELEKYPPHISKLRSKCFKYLVIQDALRQGGAIFWVDASFYALDNITQWDDVFQQVLSNGGIIFAEHLRVYKNLEYIPVQMMDFLVTNTSRQEAVPQQQSGAVLIYNTEWAFTQVLWWMYLCSLDNRCCFSDKDLSNTRNITDSKGKVIVPINRSDQSALNILLSNGHSYNVSRYSAPVNHLIFRRDPKNTSSLRRCREEYV